MAESKEKNSTTNGNENNSNKQPKHIEFLQGSAHTVQGEHVTVNQGGVQYVTGNTVEIDQGGAIAIKADSTSMKQSSAFLVQSSQTTIDSGGCGVLISDQTTVKNAKIFFEMDNALSEDYEIIHGYNQYFRHVRFGVNWSFWD